MDNGKGFFSSLFDFSFEHFVFPKVIRIVFGILVVLAAITTIGVIVMGFSRGGGLGVLSLVLSPVIFTLYVLMVRIWMEIAIVLFRIYENTRIIAGKGRSEGL
jgi:hypothetical protein